MIRALLASLLVLTLAGGARAASSNDELAGLSNREYVEYVRDRFEWLTGEGRTSHRLAEKFRRQCRASSGGDADGARACEVARAADEQSAHVLQEGNDLLTGLQQRFGGVPPWARNADAALEASIGKQQAQVQQHP